MAWYMAGINFSNFASLYGSVCMTFSNFEELYNHTTIDYLNCELWIIYDRIHTDPDTLDKPSNNTDIKAITATTKHCC